MRISSDVYGPAMNGLSFPSPLEARSRVAQSLENFQKEQIENTIAFRKNVLRIAGYGNNIDGYF